MVIQGGLSFRQAHKIVGGAVSELFEKGVGQNGLTWNLLNTWCHEIVGKDLPISSIQLEEAKKFSNSVLQRNCQGSTSPDRIRETLAHQKKKAHELEALLSKQHKQWEEADVLLHKTACELINGL